MKQNACQQKIVKNTLLNQGYVSRNQMLDQYISRTSKYIMDLREDYIIDTIHYKKKSFMKRRTWGDCIYLLKCSKDGEWNKKYYKQLKYFMRTNSLHLNRNKYFTNDY